MKRDRSLTARVSCATCSMNGVSASLIAALPCCVYRCNVAAAARRRARSWFSCDRARARFAATFEPAHPARDWSFVTVAWCVPPQPASAIVSATMPSLSSDAGELRDDLVAVRLQRLFLALRHQVDVELVDADRLELLQLCSRLRGVAEHAEAVDDLVGNELAVLRAHARVLLVVVELARLDELRQVFGNLRVVAVPLDQVHHVVGDHRREPARLLARVFDVVRDVAPRADAALHAARGPARPL